MVAFLYYPFYLIAFWYRDVFGGLINFFILFNRYTVSLLSIPLLLRTFFKPLKNEYRDGLVVFSTVFGIFIKAFLVLITTSIVFVILLIEFLIALLIAFIPIVLILMILGIDSPMWYAQ